MASFQTRTTIAANFYWLHLGVNLLHLLLIARVNIGKHGECKYFLGGDMSVLLFKNLKSVLEEKKERFIYVMGYGRLC